MKDKIEWFRDSCVDLHPKQKQSKTKKLIVFFNTILNFIKGNDEYHDWSFRY